MEQRIESTALDKAKAAAKVVVEAYWESACEDYYQAAGKSQHSNHPFKALVELKLFADAPSEPEGIKPGVTAQDPLRVRAVSLVNAINSQDNHVTASPYFFAVQQKVDVLSTPDHYYDKEVIMEDDGEVDEETWLARGDEWKGDPEDNPYTEETWEDADKLYLKTEYQNYPGAVFLTEEAANKFILKNLHHFREPRTYAYHFWRNSEICLVFEILEAFSGIEIEMK